MEENNKFILPLNLQHFAGGEPPVDPPNDPPKDPIDPPTDPPKTFNQADFDREISKMYEKFEEKFNKRAETAKAEAEKLAQMSAEEKFKYQLEQREKQIQDKEKIWILKENKYECSKILNEKGLPIAFADFCVAESAEEMNKNISLFDVEFKKAVKLEIDKRLTSSSPKTGTLGLDGQITKEQFNKMSLSQQAELYQNNPELYKQLTKR